MRRGLRELAAARLLAEDTSGGGHRPRHALLGEAVAGGLLPGERAVLHERAARALAGDPALAAEVAGHWQAAGRPAEELPARVAAAEAAERVFGYAQAAAHWQRAVELGQAQPDAAAAAGIDVPRLSVRAIDAFFRAGDSVRAGLVAEEAYRRFVGDPDPATAAVVCHRAAYFRANDAPATAETVFSKPLPAMPGTRCGPPAEAGTCSLSGDASDCSAVRCIAQYHAWPFRGSDRLCGTRALS